MRLAVLKKTRGLSVCLSVGRSVTILSRAKTAEPIEMPFGIWTRVGTENHVLDGAPGLPVRSGNFEGERYLHGKWLAERPRYNSSSTTEFEIWRNAGPSAFQLQETMLKSDKI